MIRKQSTRALSLLLALLFVVTLLPQRALGAAVSAETVEAAQIYSANAATDSALYAKVLEAPKDAPTYRDGVYRGTGQGHHSMITVEVIIENGKIAKAEVLEQNETPSYWSGAVEILQDFIGLSSEEEVGAVDTVSGATMSSAAIRYAIREALLSAEDAGIFASGQGTYQRPYLIETVQQLQDFAAAVDGGNTFEGEYIQLNANLDLSAVADWNPIGTEGKSSDGENQKASFYGDFNGAGHTISGLRIDHVYTGKMKSEANIGLFSFLGKTA